MRVPADYFFCTEMFQEYNAQYYLEIWGKEASEVNENW